MNVAVTFSFSVVTLVMSKLRKNTEYLSVFSPNTGKCGPE